MITLLIWILIFCLIAYGLFWVCQHFGLPRPIWWICGVILLLVLIAVLLRQANIQLPSTLPLTR